ncbi:MAG: hypothetical protein FJY21_08040 [Bacteroidetes bacterium]|nr:hypothetical protein [Bacteroidota bacterium]
MYRVFLFIILVFVSSCKNNQEKKTENIFFDIKGFFELEAKRLKINHPLVKKIVKQNNQEETKNSVDVDWNVEFALFVDSDINKAAWKDSYKVYSDCFRMLLLAIDSTRRTKSIEIRKNLNGKPIYFRIKNNTKSELYESSEDLVYIPDSVYVIKKNQTIRFMGNNSYEIRGKFLK